MIRETHKSKEYLLWILILGVLLKIYISLGLPRYIFGNAIHDDVLLLNYARNILSGQWLGNYSNYTLNKVPGFSLFLVVASKLHVPYILALEILSIWAIFVTLKAIDSLLKKSNFKLISGLYLLFSPIFFDNAISQRLYRNALIPAAVLLVIASTVGMYLRRDMEIKAYCKWAFLTGIHLSFFWIIREDSIWLLPLVIVAESIIIIFACLRKSNWRDKLKRIFITMIPIICLTVSTGILKYINYYHYGIFTLTDFSDTEFGYAMKNILSVKPRQEMDYIWVSKDTLEHLYKISPSLASIKDEIAYQYEGGWQAIGKLKEDGEIEKDYIIWAIRDAVSLAGYYADARMANDFYRSIGSEIETAFSNGALERREGISLSSLARPISFRNLKDWVQCAGESLYWTISYSKCNPQVSTSTVSQNIRLAEGITGNVFIYPEEEFIISGWLISKSNDISDILIIDSNNNVCEQQQAIAISSPDVFAVYGNEYTNANNARFSIHGRSLSPGIKLKVTLDNGTEYIIDDLKKQANVENENVLLHIDSIQVDSGDNAAPFITSGTSSIVNGIVSLYQMTGLPMFLLACGSFLLSAIYEIYYWLRLRKTLNFEIWIPALGILLSIVLLHIMVSINYFDAWNRDQRFGYLGGSYLSQQLFILLAFIMFKNIMKSIHNISNSPDGKTILVK